MYSNYVNIFHSKHTESRIELCNLIRSYSLNIYKSTNINLAVYHNLNKITFETLSKAFSKSNNMLNTE